MLCSTIKTIAERAEKYECIMQPFFFYSVLDEFIFPIVTCTVTVVSLEFTNLLKILYSNNYGLFRLAIFQN